MENKQEMSLEEYLNGSKYITYNILKSYINTLDELEKNIGFKQGLNGLCLDPMKISFNPSNNSFKIISDNKDKDFYYEVSKSLIRMLRSVNPNDKEALDLAYNVFTACSKDNYKISDLKKIVDNKITKLPNNLFDNQEIQVNNQTDYEKLKEFAKSFRKEQLEELQSILIQAENDPKYLSDVVSAFDKVYVEKNKEKIIYVGNNKVYEYNGARYSIPDTLANEIYQDKKIEYQLEYINELKDDKKFSWLKSLNNEELLKIAQKSKDFEEDWTVNDNIPSEAVMEAMERYQEIKKDELYDKYKSYTNIASDLAKTALELEKEPNIVSQINYLKNKIAVFEREPQVPIENNKLKL